MFSPHRSFMVLLGVAALVLPVLGQPNAPELEQSIKQVRGHLDRLGAKGNGEILPRTGDGLATAFPQHHMIVVRFRQFPVARVLPEGLAASNVFAVNKEGKIEQIKDARALQKFFHTNHAVVKNAPDAKKLLTAWLALSQEFHQDGMFKFEILQKEFAVEGDAALKATGRLMVAQGGNGQLSAELTWDKEGKLSAVLEKAAIRPGPRPICQATKLLDPDPIIRRIAEQDLLIMGLSARDYLLEQRDQASPELRRAIDQIWRDIQKNGW